MNVFATPPDSLFFRCAMSRQLAVAPACQSDCTQVDKGEADGRTASNSQELTNVEAFAMDLSRR